MTTSSPKDHSDWSRDSKNFKIDPLDPMYMLALYVAVQGKKKKEKEKFCRDQDSNLGYYGHNVMSQPLDDHGLRM